MALSSVSLNVLRSSVTSIRSNSYYVLAVSRNIISVSCLDMDGFHFIIKNNFFSIYHGDIFFMGMLIHLMVSTF